MDNESFDSSLDGFEGEDEFESKVAQWNTAYRDAGREAIINYGHRVKDMDDNQYEDFVIDNLLDIAGTPDAALAIFNHDSNEGGWMTGDVEARLKEMINGV